MGELAVLRLDGDTYESTIQTLGALYDKVSPGGFIIIDDYHLGPCKEAVMDFRAKVGEVEPMVDIDGKGCFDGRGWVRGHSQR